MNREIKFRGLDGQNNWHYGYVYHIDGTANLSGAITEKKKITVSWILVPVMPQDTGWGISDSFISMEVQENTIGQYIGLKDKNGVEIYEGDIVRLVNGELPDDYGNCKHMEGVGAVSYDERETRFAWGGTGILHWGGTQSIEVIGNIYEHPELLNAYLSTDLKLNEDE